MSKQDQAIELTYYTNLVVVAREGCRRLHEALRTGIIHHTEAGFKVMLFDNEKDNIGKLYGINMVPSLPLFDSSGISKEVRNSIDNPTTDIMFESLFLAFSNYAHNLGLLQEQAAAALSIEFSEELKSERLEFEDSIKEHLFLDNGSILVNRVFLEEKDTSEES